MLPGIELTTCTGLAVPHEVMHHVVRVESSFNPYAIGVVGGRLVRQPKNLPEAVATARMLEQRGYNFSLGVAQVNRYNLGKYGLDSYEKAFDVCPNLQAGSRILAECYHRSQDWGKSFSCYYSGNFVTGFRHGYVQKIYASMRGGTSASDSGAQAIAVIGSPKLPAGVKGGTASMNQTSTALASARRSGPARLAAWSGPAAVRGPDTAATQEAASLAAAGAQPQAYYAAAQVPAQAALPAASSPQAQLQARLQQARLQQTQLQQAQLQPAQLQPAPVQQAQLQQAPLQPARLQAAALPQQAPGAPVQPRQDLPVTVSLMHAPAAAAGAGSRAPAPRPPSQGDQAFVF